MTRLTLPLICECLLFFVPLNIYVIGNDLAHGVQWALFRYQQSYLGNSLILIHKDFMYVADGILRGSSAVLDHPLDHRGGSSRRRGHRSWHCRRTAHNLPGTARGNTHGHLRRALFCRHDRRGTGQPLQTATDLPFLSVSRSFSSPVSGLLPGISVPVKAPPGWKELTRGRLVTQLNRSLPVRAV